jgi:hypothetical protein
MRITKAVGRLMLTSKTGLLILALCAFLGSGCSPSSIDIESRPATSLFTDKIWFKNKTENSYTQVEVTLTLKYKSETRTVKETWSVWKSGEVCYISLPLRYNELQEYELKGIYKLAVSKGKVTEGNPFLESGHGGSFKNSWLRTD